MSVQVTEAATTYDGRMQIQSRTGSDLRGFAMSSSMTATARGAVVDYAIHTLSACVRCQPPPRFHSD
ncbi:MAG: hypothetical protein ABEH88_07080 [Halobacteriales archaeon]